MTNDQKICVVGSIAFHTGIGKHTFALCELLSRFTNVCVIPLETYEKDKVYLPSGRSIPVCKKPESVEVTFYCGILWNYTGDCNVFRMPPNGLHYALIAFDSDLVPRPWVDILNSRFDGVYCVNRHLEALAKNSGVDIPIGTLPLALDLVQFLIQPVDVAKKNVITIGSVSSFHPRKQNDLLIRVFGRLEDRYENIRLKIHSNLNYNSNLEYCESIRRSLANPNAVELSCKDLSDPELKEFMREIDIFVNCSMGEGFSIGPREAAALGKTLVLSTAHPHLDFEDVPGAFLVNATIPVPSEYPELEGIVAGNQYCVTEEELENKLIRAIEYVLNENSVLDALERKKFAAQWDFASVIPWYLASINPDASEFRFPAISCEGIGNVPMAVQDVLRNRFGHFSSSLGTTKKVVLKVHDGGFFSIFNAYMSHLVWSEGDNEISAVLPDWDVARFEKRMEGKDIVSFCYGKPEDGNIFLKFFETLPGVAEEMLQSEVFFNENAKIINEGDEYFNVRREPLLTYINAAHLYKSTDFSRFRHRYNRVFNKYIHLRPEIKLEVDEFCKQFENKFVIGAHVRHPSHAIEQVGKKMPTPLDYIREIQEIVEKRKLDNWVVFLATDQDRTIDIFKSYFGSKVVYYKNVRRLTDNEDRDFDELPEDGKAVEGFQLQHKVAKNHNNWSVDMAKEVIRDAWTMAQCHVLLHVTSNVSTAVSYIGPETEFITVISKD